MYVREDQSLASSAELMVKCVGATRSLCEWGQGRALGFDRELVSDPPSLLLSVHCLKGRDSGSGYKLAI